MKFFLKKPFKIRQTSQGCFKFRKRRLYEGMNVLRWEIATVFDFNCATSSFLQGLKRIVFNFLFTVLLQGYQKGRNVHQVSCVMCLTSQPGGGAGDSLIQVTGVCQKQNSS